MVIKKIQFISILFLILFLILKFLKNKIIENMTAARFNYTPYISEVKTYFDDKLNVILPNPSSEFKYFKAISHKAPINFINDEENYSEDINIEKLILKTTDITTATEEIITKNKSNLQIISGIFPKYILIAVPNDSNITSWQDLNGLKIGTTSLTDSYYLQQVINFIDYSYCSNLYNSNKCNSEMGCSWTSIPIENSRPIELCESVSNETKYQVLIEQIDFNENMFDIVDAIAMCSTEPNIKYKSIITGLYDSQEPMPLKFISLPVPIKKTQKDNFAIYLPNMTVETLDKELYGITYGTKTKSEDGMDAVDNDNRFMDVYSIRNYIVTRDDTPEDLVYQLTKVIHETKSKNISNIPKQYRYTIMTINSSLLVDIPHNIEIHNGTKKYLREIGFITDNPNPDCMLYAGKSNKCKSVNKFGKLMI